jgi:hypothetical protein
MSFYPDDLNKAKSKADREEAVRHAIGSARIEGLELSDETILVMQKWADGEMSTNDLKLWRKDYIERFKSKSSSPKP